MMVFVLGASFPLGALADTIVTVDIKANGSDGPITITDGDSYSYDWTSLNASSCQITSPANSGIPLSGSDTVSPGSPFYPAVGAPMILTVVCTDGLTTATDAVTINLASLPPPPPATPTVDIKANASDGPITIADGDSYTYSWTSTNSSSCQITSPANSGIPLSGSDTVLPGSPFYPAIGAPMILTVVCTDGLITATDAVTINLSSLPPPPPPPPASVTATLSANPTSVLANATSTLTWSSTGATSCSAPWTSATTTSGTQIVTVATTTTYSITCTDGVNSSSANATVTVTAPPVVPPGGGGGGGSCTLPTISSSLAASATINEAFSYTITTTSTSTPILTVATSSLPAGLSFATSTGIISGTPTQIGTFNIALTSSNPCGNDAKTLVITVAMPAAVPPAGGGGGGGGGSSGGHRRVVPPVVSTGLECFYLHDYMRRDFNNDPEQVMRLQAFLKAFEGYDYVTINGVFDQATFDAVSAFQTKYQSDILTPWGHTAPTGYVYILTLKKINELYCQRLFPIDESQAREIVAFKALLESLQNQGYPVEFTPQGTVIPPPVGAGTSTQVELPIVGQVSPPQGQILNNLATAMFSTPVGLENILRCLYDLLLVLIVLYILVNVLEDVLYKKIVDVRRRFLTKWATICVGLCIAIILAYIWGLWCLILPLLIALLISLAWIIVYPIHDKIKTSVKSWYLVLSARAKTILKKK